MRKICFLTGTRADYGKMKPLMKEIEESENFECHIFVTGMHTLQAFGGTQLEVFNDGFQHIQVYMNQILEEPMDLILANTINGFSRYIRELKPDMIIIHGDRVEALAGAITGALNNIRVAHIEGGELSGTIDESIRHAISKLAHIHFVSNEIAKKRLSQLGEQPDSIYVIGSPDIDALVAPPSVPLNQIKERYDITFDHYSVAMYHPVTTELSCLRAHVKSFVDALIDSNDNFIVISPNNDAGYEIILNEYERLKNCERFRCFPSIRFEYFIELLRNADYLIGNSSACIHEAPAIGLASVSVGTRQNNRFHYQSILESDDSYKSIVENIEKVKKLPKVLPTSFFGSGSSRICFREVINSKDIWNVKTQKVFVDHWGEF